jgi:hypothetical protein
MYLWNRSKKYSRYGAYIESLPRDQGPNLKRESPQFTGRIIAALYQSALRMKLSGRALIGAELGATLGVKALDGSAPVSCRYALGGPPELHETPRYERTRSAGTGMIWLGGRLPNCALLATASICSRCCSLNLVTGLGRTLVARLSARTTLSPSHPALKTDTRKLMLARPASTPAPVHEGSTSN